MLLTLTLGFTTAISLNYFNSTKFIFWKRILIIFLTFNFVLLVEGVGGLITSNINTSSWSNLISLNSWTFTFLCLIFISSLGILVIPNKTLFEMYNDRERERYLFILTILLGGILLITSTDFLTIFLGLELQSYSVYLLAASYRNYEPSESAGLKYFLLGALSSTFILMGFILLYVYSGTTSLTYNLLISTDLSAFIPFESKYFTGIRAYNILPYIGLLLVFIGVSWKLAAAPLHAWSIDVYDAVPGRLTAVLSLLPKIGLFSFLVKLLKQLQFDTSNYLLQDFMLSSIFQVISIIIIISLLLGSILGLRQSRIKRLLAYSSVLNVGFIFIAALLTRSSSISAFYVIQYILTTVAVWICLTNLSSTEITLNSQLQGLRKTPLLQRNFIAICLSLLILSTAGIPPMVGFFAKFDVILLSVQSGYITLALIAILASLISTVYYLNIVKNIWFKAPLNNKLLQHFSVLTFSEGAWRYDLKRLIQPDIEKSQNHVLIFLSLTIVLYPLEYNVVSTFFSLL